MAPWATWLEHKAYESNGLAKGYKSYALKSFKEYLSMYQGDQILVEKTPRNYEVYKNIQNDFDNAQFIVLKREELAIIRSINSTWCRNKFKRNS